MTEETTIPRRSVLAVGAAGVVVTGAALAGCGSDSSGGGGTAATTAPADTGASTGGSSAPASGGSALAKLADIPAGGSMKVTGPDGKPMILFRDGNTVTGHSAICTHMGCTVDTAGAELNCPCHKSKFNAQTGAVINGPAASPLPEIKVSVSGDSVVAG